MQLYPGFFRISDPLQIYRINYWIYVFMGFWVYISSGWKGTSYKVYQFVLVLIYTITCILFLLDAVAVRHDLDKLSFNMSSSVLVFVTVTKVSMLMSNRHRLEEVLYSLDNDLNLERIGDSADDKEIFEKRAKIMVGMTKLLYGLLVLCFFLRLMADTALDTRSYLIPMPYKEQLENHYEIIYAQQIVAISHFIITVIAHDLFIYGIINRFMAHFEILEKNFHLIKTFRPKVNYGKFVRGYKDGNNKVKDVILQKESLNRTSDIDKMYRYNAITEEIHEEKTRQLLKDSFLHHQKLLKEVMSFVHLYKNPLIVQSIGSVLLIGIVAVKILFLSSQITILLIQQLLYVGITLINILFLCSYGSELTNKSIVAGDALYDTPWYEMNLKNQRTVSFALKKFRAVPKLRAGSFIIINRRTYLKLLRTSYNMVVVLRNIY